jgi:hypothetical protein
MPVEAIAVATGNHGNHGQQVRIAARVDRHAGCGRAQDHHSNSFQLFVRSRGDKLSLTATDLDLSLRTSCSAKVKKEGSCTIPARKLHDYVKLLPDADITIKLLENHWVSIRCGRSNTKMVGMAKSNFPSLPVFPTPAWSRFPARCCAP